MDEMTVLDAIETVKEYLTEGFDIENAIRKVVYEYALNADEKHAVKDWFEEHPGAI